jgi:hypothetical protein
VTIQSIETLYKGYRFRSRLEARWAVFFDALGLQWEYEPEGFELPGGRYLPDFFLRGLDTYVEVKGAEPTSAECRKVEELAAHTGKNVLLVDGDPMRNVDANYYSGPSAEWSIHFPTGGLDTPFYFCVCPGCGKVGLEFSGWGARICGNHSGNDHKAHSADHPRIVKAATAARSARFEFGETPR